jgi:hypothetical protein
LSSTDGHNRFRRPRGRHRPVARIKNNDFPYVPWMIAFPNALFVEERQEEEFGPLHLQPPIMFGF